MRYGMSVDYRLQEHFAASCRRHDEARRALPARWRSDPRPEAQIINDLWVGVVARAREQIERAEQQRSETGSAALDDR